MSKWVRVAADGDCPVGALKGVMADGTPEVLANVEGKVICLYHGARFDACSGDRKSLPAIRPVQSFPVEIRDGDIYVDVG